MKKSDSPFGRKISRSQKIAVGGIFSSLSLIALLAGGILPLASFSAPVFAGLFFIPVFSEIGLKFALLSYLTVSILSLLMVSDVEMVFLFIFILGYYPILQFYLQRIKKTFLKILTKFAIFNLALCATYGTLFLFYGMDFFFQNSTFSYWTIVAFLILGNIIFYMYDILVTRLRFFYFCFFRKKIFH